MMDYDLFSQNLEDAIFCLGFTLKMVYTGEIHIKQKTTAVLYGNSTSGKNKIRKTGEIHQ